MTKKQLFILGVICISTPIGSSVIKMNPLFWGLIIALILFFLVFFTKKKWSLNIAKMILVPYSLIAIFTTFTVALYYFFPKRIEPYPLQSIGGTRELIALILGLFFSGFLAWTNRKDTDRKTILIYIGGIAICLLPVLLKRIL